MKPDYLLFTDGSVVGDRGSAAFLIINNSNGTSAVKTEYLGRCDSMYAETHAIFRGLEYASKLISKTDATKISPKKVLVFSDCKNSIDFVKLVVSDFLSYESYRNYKKRKYFKSDKIYCKFYDRFLTLIASRKMTFMFIHINSHLSEEKYHKIITSVRNVGFELSDEDAMRIIEFNRIVDKNARSCAKSGVEI